MAYWSSSNLLEIVLIFWRIQQYLSNSKIMIISSTREVNNQVSYQTIWFHNFLLSRLCLNLDRSWGYQLSENILSHSSSPSSYFDPEGIKTSAWKREDRRRRMRREAQGSELGKKPISPSFFWKACSLKQKQAGRGRDWLLSHTQSYNYYTESDILVTESRLCFNPGAGKHYPC